MSHSDAWINKLTKLRFEILDCLVVTGQQLVLLNNAIVNPIFMQIDYGRPESAAVPEHHIVG